MILERLSSSVTCPEPCKFPSLDSCQMRFLWTHNEVDLALHPVVGLVLQVGETEFSHALGFKSLDFFFRVSKQGPCFTGPTGGGEVEMTRDFAA